ncbi:MAG: heavy metal-associated domain-containing protein [Pirellulaceae bacterium]
MIQNQCWSRECTVKVAASTIEKALMSSPGIQRADVDLAKELVTVAGSADLDTINDIIRECGYDPKDVDAPTATT